MPHFYSEIYHIFIYVVHKIFSVSVTLILAANQNVSLGQSTKQKMVQDFGALMDVGADATPSQEVI